MPPAISDDDDDSDGPDQVPAKGKLPVKAPVEAEEDDDDEDEDEDEFRVEKILAHDWVDDKEGAVIYQIKWLGYEDEADLTWEPLENLENAVEVLEAYHKEIGEVPEPKPRGKRKGPKAGTKRNAATALLDSTPASGKKRGRKSDTNGAADEAIDEKFVPPEGMWDDSVTRVTSLVEDDLMVIKGGVKAKVGRPALLALLEWDSGHRTQHPLPTVRRKAPQKLLDYYERHLVFKNGPEDD